MHGEMPHIVLDSIDGPEIGSLIETPDMRQRLERGGVAVIPVDPQIMEHNALAGFAMRHFGHGVRLPYPAPDTAAQLIIWLSPERPTLHWRARVALDHEAMADLKSGQRIDGRIEIIGDSSQPPAFGGGLGRGDPFLFSSIETDGAESLIVAGGIVPCRVDREGFYGLALRGTARGARLLWFAASQTA